MNPLVCQPLWHWLTWVAAIAAGVAIPVGISCAYAGAALAIRLCAKQQGCAMRMGKEKQQTTQDLEEQLRALHLKHPELAQARRAMAAILKESGDHPAIPERVRAKKDEEGQR